MEDREEIIETCIPISLKARTWEEDKASMEKEASFEECISAIGAPGFHSEALSPEKAIIRLYSIKEGLEALVDSCIMVLNEVGANGPPNWKEPMLRYIQEVSKVKESLK